MPEYVVYRIDEPGAVGGAGRPVEKRCVARVVARDAEEACRRALDEVTLAEGQRLSAEPADAVDAHEHALDLKVEALERPENFRDEEVL